MTNRLDELRGLLDQATAGPWATRSANVFDVVHPLDNKKWLSVADTIAMKDRRWEPTDKAGADAALIVFLRNHAEDLLAVARAQIVQSEDRWRCLLCGRSWAFEEFPLHRGGCVMARLSPTSEEGS